MVPWTHFSGRLCSKRRLTGEILINGHKQALAYGTSAYLTQDDAVLTTLTVREAVYYSAQLQLSDSMSEAEKKERADFTIKEMGLQDSINTKVGGWGCKGVSGGQKRRVSICIEILTHPRLLFLDEPTRGLDSAASYYVMRRIARLNQMDGIQRTIIVSIHQPSSEVFQLFHNLCLLSYGKTVFFGPASASLNNLSLYVFERERLNGHYGVTAHVIGHTVSSIPYLLLVSVVPGAIVYQLARLHPGYQNFVYFISVLFVSVMLVESIMMIVATIVPNFLTGIITGAGIMGMMMLAGGFYRLPNDLPIFFWKYPLYYVSIHKYAYQGLFKNEFEDLTFDNNRDGIPAKISGEEMLRDLWQLEMCHSKWVDLAILLGMVALCRILFLVIIKGIEKFKSLLVLTQWYG